MIVIRLTKAEAVGLEAFASEGHESLMTNPDAAKAYIGNSAQVRAAESGYAKLQAAISAAARPAP